MATKIYYREREYNTKDGIKKCIVKYKHKLKKIPFTINELERCKQLCNENNNKHYKVSRLLKDENINISPYKVKKLINNNFENYF